MKHFFTFCQSRAVAVRLVCTLMAGLGLGLVPKLALAQLTISSTSPVANARAATAAGPVAVTFNQAVTAGSTAALRVFSAQRGGLRSGTSGTTSVSGSTVSFAPTYAFRPGETVQATMRTTATATAGGATLATARVLQFTAAAGGTGTGNFRPGTDVVTAATPEVVAADFNNDGILDLADTGGGLTVRLGTGGALYSPAVSYPAASGSSFTLTAGDLDNDGDLDLVVPRSSGPITVLRNNGSGTFTALTDAASSGNDPRKAALGDIDGDGDLDMLVPVSAGGGAVGVYFGNGSGGFAAPVLYTGASNAVYVVLGDVDKDGDLDYAVSDYNNARVVVRLNDGSGLFLGGSNVAVNTQPNAVVLGDVNGDGALDILTANEGASVLSVALNTNAGTGSFAAFTQRTVPTRTAGLALGDVDADGDLDVVASSGSGGTGFYTCLNNGSGSFGSAVNTAGAGPIFYFSLADLDNDGDLDLAGGYPGTAALAIRLNQVPAPTLASLLPTSGLAGSSVITLTGTGFTGATGVSFNGTAATTFNATNSTTATATVPAGARPGLGTVTITTPGGPSNGVAFTVTLPASTISSFAPATGPAGTSVTITGTNLDYVTGVRFGTGALTTNFVSQSANSLTVRVPVVAATGVISLTNGASATVSSATAFTYAPAPYAGQLLATISPAGPLDACQVRTLTAAAARRGVITGAGFDGGVTSMAVQADGKVLAGGGFTTYQGATAPHLIRLNADGSRDATFDTGTGLDNAVNSVAVQADGKVLVGGSFNSFQGALADYLIRLNADGSRDLTFDTGAGFSGSVNTVAVQADGKVLVGGFFGTYRNATADFLIRLNADGSRDATFNTDGGFNSNVTSLAVQADGKVLVGGNFSNYRGATASRLIRLNTDGSPDAGFVAGTFNSTVNTVAVQADGKVLVGGSFSIYQGVAATFLIRLNTNGSPDAGFATGASFNGSVTSLAVQADGQVLAGGVFTTYQGTTALHLIRLNTNASFDGSFVTGTGFDNIVQTVALQADGRVLAGGLFTTHLGVTANYFAPLNANGTSNTQPTPVSGASFTFSPGNTTTNPLVTSATGSYTAVASLGGNTSAPSNTVVLGVCPTISSFAPASGPAGTSVTFTGTDLDNITGVRFGTGTLTTNFVSQSATSLTVRVPVVATTGVITLTNAAGTNLATATAFTYTPTAYVGQLLATLSPAGPLDVCQARTLTATASRRGVSTGTSFNGGVTSTAVQADGKVLAGGGFTTYQGATASRFIRLNADGSPDAGFATGAGFNSNVTNVAVQADGKVLAGGNFTTYQGTLANYLIRLNADGSRDASFAIGTGFNSNVNTVAVQADGKVLVGGTFTTYQGAAAIFLVRLNADGSPDAGFATGTGVNGNVSTVAVQADGKVLVGGTFTTYQGAPVNYLIRLNADGSRDAGFATGTGFNNTVSTVAVQADGKVLVGGTFTTYQGATAVRLVRLNADGSPDAGFATGAGFNTTVNSLAVQADGQVLVGGDFSTYNNTTGQNRLVRLNTDGSRDAGFATGTGFNSTVSTVAVQADGRVLAGGNFTTYQGATAVGFMPLNADGSSNAAPTPVSGASFTFSPGNTTTNPLVTSTASSYSVVANLGGDTSAPSNTVLLAACPTVSSFAPASGPAGTSVTITGTGLDNITGVRFGTGALTTNFVSQSATSLTVRVPVVASTGVITLTNNFGTTVPTATAFTYAPRPAGLLAALSPAGPFDACQPRTLTATASSPAFVTGVGFSSAVNSVVVQADGKVLAGGNFTAYQGAAANRLIRLNVDGSPDAGFATGAGFGSTVNSVAVQADGKVLVGGLFATYQGATANRLIRLNADGSPDATFVTGTGFSVAGNSVTSVAVQADGKVLVSGTFTTYQGATANRLIRLNADGSPDAGFAIGAGFNNTVNSVVVQADGKVLAGGTFTTYQGATTNRLIRLNTDGSPDATFATGTGVNGIVSSVAVQADGKVLVGGLFTFYQSTTANRLIRLNANGSSDAGFATGAGFNNTVNSVVMQADGKVLVSGLFATYQGATANRLIRLNTNGTPDASFATGVGFNTTVSSVAVQADGQVLAGGAFGTYQGATANRLVRLTATGSLNTTATAVSGATFTFSPGSTTANPLVTSTAGSYTAVASLNGETSGASNAVELAACPAPVISSLSTPSGPVGTSVTIAGTDLAFASSVSFNGTAQTTISANTATSLTVTVPPGATTGNVTVTTNGGTSNGLTFTVTNAPTVTTATPTALASTSATLGGNATADGGSAVIERGVVYVPGTGTPTTTDTKVVMGSGTGAFSQSVAGLTAATQYTVRAYATNGVGTGYGSAETFTAVGPLMANITSQTNVNCFGGTNGAATVSATGGLAPYTYSWNTTPARVTATITGLTAGTYTVTVTDAAGQTDQATATITAPPALAVTQSQTNATCFGGSNGTASVSVGGGTPGYTYNWLPGNPTGDGTASVSGLTAGSWSVLITDANGCSFSSNFTIGQPAAFSITPSQTNVSVSGGNDGTASVSVSGGTGAYTYNWTPNNPTGDGTASVSGLSAGTYAVLVTDANGCTTSPSFTITQPGTAAPVVTTPANVTLTNDPTPTYVGSGPAGSTITVLVDGTAIGTTTATGGAWSLTQPTPLADGPHTVNATAMAGTTTSGVSNTNGFTVDATAPTALLSSTAGSSGGTTTTSPIPFAVTFAEPVNGFTPGGLTVSNGTVSAFGGTGTAYTFEVTPTAAGLVTVRVNANAAQDAAGNGNAGSPTYSLTYSLPDLTISTTGAGGLPIAIAAGSYNNVTITGSGFGQLAGAVTVNGAVLVQGNLSTNCQPLTGTGTFTLAAGATLGICDATGLSSTGPSGAVQVAGTRSFSADASYTYNGTVLQSTGAGLPATVRNLTTTNAQPLTLTQPVTVAQVLTLAGSGNLNLTGQALTLRSSATGTALVVNAGTGVVSGPATVQRYIDGSLNSGLGYRHFSAPVANTTVADLATAGFAPEVSQAAVYNTSATPGTTTPFPTVFGYDQARLITASNSNFAAFDKGFFVPAGLGTALTPGRGYAVNISASQLVDFRGTLGTGELTRSLARTSGPTAADAGWQLVGNPYPAPLDWSLVATADRAGLDGSMYVVQSSGPYAGGYRSYVNGQSTTGTNNPLIASSQGFWVRVSQGNTAGSLTFRNAQRVTDYATQVAFQRGGTPDLRPALRLTLAGSGLADAWVAYAQAGATAGVDAQFDAAKLANATGLNLSSEAGADNMAIDGQAAFTAATVLPLAVGVPAAGAYTLALAEGRNLPAGLTAYLRDAQTGSLTVLAPGTSYAFRVTNAQALGRGRFAVVFRASVLATSPAALAAQVGVYPNPARAFATLDVPGVAGASQVQVQVLNALGQVVLRQQATLPASGTRLTLPTGQLASGVYVVRLTLGQTTLTKRLTVE